MIMKRYLLVFAFVVLAVPSVLYAQEISVTEKRSVNMKILNLIEEYERTSSLSDSEEVYAFLDLFYSQESKVFCDLMGTSAYMSTVNVRDYVKSASASFRDMDIIIKDVRKGEMSWDSGVWTIPLSFRKTMSYVDRNGVLFSAEEFYGKEDYRITMNVVYDPAANICRIGSIEGYLNAQKSFPEDDFYVVKKNDYLSGRNKAREARLTADGMPLEYNSFNQAIIPVSSVFSVGDPDVLIDTNVLASTETYKLVNLSFKSIKGRIKVRAGFAPVMAYNATSYYGGKINNRSFAFETGLDIGTTFTSNNAKCGLYIGAALSMSYVTLNRKGNYSIGSISYFDDDRGYYVSSDQNYYRNVSESEKLTLKDIVIPAYFETEHRLGENVLLTWNIGAKTYLPLFTEIGEYLVTGKFEVGNTNDRVENLPDIKVNKGFLHPVMLQRNQFSVSAMANMGVDVNIKNNRLFASFKAGYEHGLMNVIETENCSMHSDATSSPLLYHPEGTIVCHSPLSGLTLKRQAVWFELGLKVKM